MSWKPRLAAKAACKVDKALYQCQICKAYVYEGSSPVTYDYYLQVYGNKVLFDKFFIDHIQPVVPIEGLGIPPDYNWIIHYKRLFCPEENLQGICKVCHDSKSSAENKQRKIFKTKKKPATH